MDVIEAGFPAASPGDFEAVQRIAAETKGIAVAGLARCRDGDPQRAIEALRVAEKPHLHLFIATSDIHLVHKLRMDREAALQAAVQWVRYARRELGPDAEIEFSAEDASRTEHDFLLRVYEAVVDAGATTVNIPDTVGYAIPAEFGELTRKVVERVGAGATISVHCHNDLGLATANTLAAVQAGARQVEVTINGLGERAGNASLEEVVMALRTRPTEFDVRGSGVNTEQISNASRLVSYLTGLLGAAQQGHRGPQRLRPRIGHPPGRRAQERADLRDHDAAVGGPRGLPAHGRQALRPARPAGQAPRARRATWRARPSTASTARPSPWPTPRRRSPTPTSSPSSSPRRPRLAWPRTSSPTPRSGSRAGRSAPARAAAPGGTSPSS